MRAEIVSIGTEILLGEIVDTNSAYIAARLPALGIDLYYEHVVGDNQGRLVEVFRRAWERSDLIITTGGLGPTEDDLTRESIAELMGEQIAVDPEQEEILRARYRQRNAVMPERNIKQAWLIPSARAVLNPRGSAPGWWVERDGKRIVSMPGPPAEMTRMWDEEVAPALLKLNPGIVLVKRTLKTAGLGESNVDEVLSPLLKTTNPSVGIYARGDGVHVRLAAKAPSPAQAQALIEPVEMQMRQLLAPHVWGTDDDTFESVIGDMLKKRGLTLAAMESCTGGLFADTVTNVPGSSAYFRGGIVSYATDVKELMGVDPAVIAEHGVVSQPTANAMAQAVRERLHADIGVGITGVAGPDPQDGVPVGQVYIAVATGPACQRSSRSSFPSPARRSSAAPSPRPSCCSTGRWWNEVSMGWSAFRLANGNTLVNEWVELPETWPAPSAAAIANATCRRCSPMTSSRSTQKARGAPDRPLEATGPGARPHLSTR